MCHSVATIAGKYIGALAQKMFQDSTGAIYCMLLLPKHMHIIYHEQSMHETALNMLEL
jgi:hypothetical protein